MATSRNPKNTPRPGSRIPRDRYGRPLPQGSPDELADHEDPATAAGSMVEAFDRAVDLFDARRFFEAHEYFEYIWKTGPEDERPFWKALTQYAAGLCHCQRGNAPGSRTLIARALARLGRHPSPYRGVDVEALAAAAQELAVEVERRGASPDLDFPRFPLT